MPSYLTSEAHSLLKGVSVKIYIYNTYFLLNKAHVSLLNGCNFVTNFLNKTNHLDMIYSKSAIYYFPLLGKAKTITFS